MSSQSSAVYSSLSCQARGTICTFNCFDRFLLFGSLQSPYKDVWSSGTCDIHGKELCRLNSFWCEEKCSSFGLNLFPANFILYPLCPLCVYSTGSVYSICIHPHFVGSHQIPSGCLFPRWRLSPLLGTGCTEAVLCIFNAFYSLLLSFSEPFCSLLNLSVAGMWGDHRTWLSGHSCIDIHSGRVMDSAFFFPNSS